jgi:peptidoglycan/xylan/chitin deacetylase (PgdA/CDA1 family)
MKVSVIIPARDAADTIAETFRSLREQTHADWEAIVIDDGSSDATADITRRAADADPRFRLITGDATGVSAARNKGLLHASADWILFLDADDWILPTHLEKLTECLRQDPGVGGATCGYARVAADGTVLQAPRWWQPNRLFESFAKSCLWTVHSCIVRKKLIDEVGGFLPGWKTCEDWDLWQRITRTGARFAFVDEALALYRMRPGSASLDAVDMVRGTIATINRGHGPDPRVPHPAPEYADGAPPEGAPRARILAVSWSAAILIGHGRDAGPAVDSIRGDRDPRIDPDAIASNLFWGVLLPTARSTDAWIELLREHEERIDAYLRELEEITGTPLLARRTRRALERHVMIAASPRVTGVLGHTQMVTVEATEPLRDLAVEPGAERVACRVLLEGRLIGTLHLPVVEGTLARAVLADAAADALWSPLLQRYLADSVHGRLARSRHRAAWLGGRAVDALSRRLGSRRTDFERWARLSIDWVALLAEMFAPVSAKSSPEPTDRIDVEIARPIPRVRTAATLLQVRVTCGGIPVGWVAVPAGSGRVSAARIRRAVRDACGQELARLAVREGILGRPIDASVPLRDVLAARADAADAEAAYRDAGTTWFVGPAADNAIGTSDSRRVQLPAALADELRDAFPVLRRRGDGPPRRVFHAPECVKAPESGALPPVDAASRMHRARDIVRRLAERGVPALRRRNPSGAVADRLPILMYHSIAERGPAGLATWRVTPSRLDDHLRFLRERGYSSVTLEQWRTARDRRRQLRGRPVLLTFDDGYQDFADTAWPLLRKYGFSAIVYLVTDRIGGKNDWDDCEGHELPLMDWETIRSLRDEGVEFGSHTCTHPSLTALTPAEVVHEGLRSRRVLEERLGGPIRSIAYPSGDQDPVVEHLMGGCGYRFGLTCRPEVGRYTDALLDLPRLNVDPSLTPEGLAQEMELRYRDLVG